MDACPAAKRLRGPALAFAAVFLVLLCLTKRGVSPYDEAIILVGATRVQDGAIPYRDFYANYGPGQFYILAGLFELFGRSVLVERLWDTTVRTAIVLLVYALVRAGGPGRTALVAAVLTTAWLGSVGAYGYPVYPCLLCSLAMILCLVRAKRSGSAPGPWLFAAGCWTGASVLFRFDVGFYDAVVLAVAAWTGVRGAGNGLIARLLPTAAACAAGIAAVCLPAAVALAACGALPALLFDNVTFPASTYAAMRSLPFPRPSELLRRADRISIYAPLVVASLVGVILFTEGRREAAGAALRRPSRWLLVSLALLSVALFVKGIVRVSVVHMTLSFVPALVLAALASRTFRRGTGRAVLALDLAAAGCVAVVVAPTLRAAADDVRTLAANATWIMRPGTASASSCRPDPHLKRMRCFQVDPSWSALVAYVQDHAAPDRTIFAGLPKHDIVVMNDVLLYFATDRRPATPWYHMDPGLQTSARVQSEMIDDLRAQRPALVILDGSWDAIREPNGSAVSSGVHLLDVYIADHYVPVARFGASEVYAPRP